MPAVGSRWPKHPAGAFDLRKVGSAWLFMRNTERVKALLRVDDHALDMGHLNFP